MLKHTTLFAAVAVLALGGLYVGTTYAEEQAPTASVETKTEVKTEAAPTTTEAATTTKSPMCSMMKWVTTQVKDYAGDDCRCCGKAMKKWFAGGADVPLAGLRDHLVADGWTAESTIAYLKEMKQKRCSDCGDCDKGDCGDCDKGDCGDCDKGDCGDCDKGDCGDCGDCAGKCNKAKDAPKTAKKDAAS